MKHEIKQLNDTRAVVISDEEITYNNYVFSDGLIGKYSTNDKKFLYLFIKDKQIISRLKETCKKIIATISPFKLEGLPMHELPNQEEDVDFYCWNIAKEIFEQEEGRKPDVNTDKDLLVMSAIQVGYKAAQKQYSEEDMFNFAAFCNNDHTLDDSNKDNILWTPLWKDGIKMTNKEMMSNYLQSLQKKQFPTSVELTEDFKPKKWYYER